MRDSSEQPTQNVDGLDGLHCDLTRGVATFDRTPRDVASRLGKSCNSHTSQYRRLTNDLNRDLLHPSVWTFLIGYRATWPLVVLKSVGAKTGPRI